MTKYYLQIEIRYDTLKPSDVPEDDFVSTYHNKFIHSDLFETQKEAIDFGNKIIEDNKWIEQYPGYVGDRLNNRFGRPLVAPSLKNGAQIFISIQPLNILSFDSINEELRKFDTTFITKVL